MPAKNCQNSPWFDKVIAKTKWCSFFTDMVVVVVDLVFPFVVDVVVLFSSLFFFFFLLILVIS